jgi:dTDP-glucose 4,6-dehydratase
MVNESWKSPLDWYLTNFLSTVKIVNFLLKKKYLKKFINFTTPEVYGNNKKKLSEEAKFNPSTPYALSRASADTHMKLMNKYKKFPIIFTRAANVYGPYQQLYRIVPKTIILLIKKKKIPIDGNGLTFRSFIHINDVNMALYKILQHGKTGETYHISTSNYISIIDLVKKIIKILRKTKNFNKFIYYKRDRIGKDEFYKLSSKKIIKNLNWKPTITLDDGINDVVEWIQKNYKFLAKNKLTYQHKK